MLEQELNTATEESTVDPTPRKKTMTEAALAANRANAQKSTGPRTAAGKARSASNALQHGLYSMSNFTHLLGHPDLVAITTHNLLEEYQPITPTEHMLLHQLIHMQLRFIQMENFINQYLLEGKHDIADRAYVAVLRELDRIPARMLKVIKALKDTIRERGANPEIEPIEDPPPIQAPEEVAKSRNQPIPAHPTGPEISGSITKYIYEEFCRRMNIDPNNYNPAAPPADAAL